MNEIKFKTLFRLGVGFIALTILILISNQCTFSQQEKYNFDKLITNEENYPLEINCMIKDKKGFIWFGTDFGLHRFEGYNFKIYDSKPGDSTSLGNHVIHCLYDEDRYLWIGTSQGLHRFDKITEQFKEFRLSYLNNFVYVIFPSLNDELWIGTGNGLSKFDKNNEKFTNYKIVLDNETLGGLFVNQINSLFEDKNGYLWIGTNEIGLYRYDIKNKKFKNYKHNSKDTNSLSSNAISHILEDIKGNIWISTYGGGLNEFNKKTERFKNFLHDSLKQNSIISDVIYSMIIDKDQKLWFASREGASIYDPNQNSFTNLKRENNLFPLFFYCDNNGIVWMYNTDQKGLSNYNKYKWKFYYYKNIHGEYSETFNTVTSVCEDHLGNFWIGTFRGIDILNKKKEKIRHLEHNPKDSTSLGNNDVRYIFKDSKDFMWIGSRNGPLDRYDTDKDIFTHYYDFGGKVFTIFNIIEDRKKNLWLGLAHIGIRVLDSNRRLIKEYHYSRSDSSGPKQLPTFTLFEDSKENLWIGTKDGLVTIDLKTDSIIIFTNNPSDPNSLSSNYVLGINEDHTGNLWVGTRNGLNSFDIINKSFKKYNNIKGGGNDFIRGLMKDSKGNFWSSTGTGITMFSLNTRTFKNFSSGDGLQVNSYTPVPQQYKARDGEVFFLGSKGLTSFYPDSIPINNNIPTIVLTDFRVFNKEVKLDTSIIEKKVITISYKENFFSFDYASLDYTSPEKNQHAYMLEGIDKDWNNVGNIRTANYTDIEPGEYIFRVKGSNNDGVWNEEGTSVKVIITPSWWQTWWFKTCGVALVFLTVGYGFKKRISQLKKENTEQEEFSRKLLKSQEQERKRLANELHDSVAHDILILKNSAVIAMGKTNDDETKSVLNEISEQSSLTLNDVRNISYNLHPQQLESLGLTKAIKSIINKASKSTDIKFLFEGDIIDKIFSEENELYIYRIVQEAVNNIIKHSLATEALIRISRQYEFLNIIISDDGKGFSKAGASAKNSLGLSGISERVKLLGGSLEVESENGMGTNLKIIIPTSL